MKKILVVFAIVFSSVIFSQNSLFFQQKALLNPAMACMDNKANISFSTVFAYNSFYTARLNTEYQIKDHHNVLFNGYYEKLNGYSLFNLRAGYGYAFKFSEAFNMNVALDLGLGIITTGVINSQYPTTSASFNGDLGISFYGKSYYIGANVQYVQKPVYNIIYPSGVFLNIVGGITKPIGENLRFSMDAAFNTGFDQTRAAASARLNIWGYFWFGFGYRYYEEFYFRQNSVAGSNSRHDIVVPIGLQAKNFIFSYAFNYDVSNPAVTVTSSFHEIIFGWRIPHASRTEEPGAQYVE